MAFLARRAKGDPEQQIGGGGWRASNVRYRKLTAMAPAANRQHQRRQRHRRDGLKAPITSEASVPPP